MVKSERPRNVADKEITNYNANRKVRNVNMPRDIPALTPKTAAAPVVNKIADKVADKVVSKAETKAPVVVKDVLKKVVKSAPSELDSYKSSNPALKRQFADNSRLAQAVRSSDYGNSDGDIGTQMRLNEANDFFKKRGVNGLPAAMKKGGVAKKLAKGGAVSLKPITGKALKPLSSKSITAAAKGMQKAVKPARPAKAFAKGGLAMKTAKPKAVVDKNVIKTAMKVPKAKMAKTPPAAPLPDPKLFKAKGGAVKCSKSSKAIDGCAKKGLTKGSKPKIR